MKIEGTLFLVIALLSSVSSNMLALDNFKNVAQIVAVGVGFGVGFGVAGTTYTSLRFPAHFQSKQESIPTRYYNAVTTGARIGMLIGIPAAAACQLGSRSPLKAKDVMRPLAIGMISLFGFTSAAKEYNYYQEYQTSLDDSHPWNHYYSSIAAIHNTQMQGACATALLGFGLIPAYLLYKRCYNV